MDSPASIPHFILERGDFARENRRRSSCVSRTSSSSLSHISQSSSSSSSSSFGSFVRPRDIISALDAYGGASHHQDTTDDIPCYDLDNYQLGCLPPPLPPRSDSAQRHSLLTSSDADPNKQISDDRVIRIQHPRNASITMGQRFGIAKPKIVHF
ncbi:hypothetical protein GQ54DRAFT_294737 [Martensiomyces pterosporus]|nr:hypothetical protein GQ54DRAFT_294737 [Martensiomyces pterosporus]